MQSTATSGATTWVFPLDLVFFHFIYGSVLVVFHSYLVFFYE